MPGAHNAVDAAGALEAARLAGARRGGAIAGLAGSTAPAALSALGRSLRGALLYDDYAHHPTEIAATLAAARTLEHAAADRGLSAASVLAHRDARAEFGRALALADEIVVLDVYPARERAEDHPGVSGLTIAQASADASGGRPVTGCPRSRRPPQCCESTCGRETCA